MKIDKKIIKILKSGGVAVLPTDTIYGLVGSALNKKTVARIYKIKKRSPKKQLIVLIGDLRQLKLLGIKVDHRTKEILNNYWPGPTSIVLRCPNKNKLSYLFGDTQTLAIRLPKPQWLRNLLKKTGPLVAPSCNPEGQKPTETILEAKKYFAGQVDFYLSANKRLTGQPSTLLKIENKVIITLREGRK